MLRRPLQLQTGENTGFIITKDLRNEALIKIHLKTVHFQMLWASTHSRRKQNPAFSTPSLPKAPVGACRGVCTCARKGACEGREGPYVVWKPHWGTYFKQKSTNVLSYREPTPKEIPKQNLPGLPTFQTLLTAGSSFWTKETLSALHRWMQPLPSRARTSNRGQAPRTPTIHNLRPYYSHSYQQNA